MPDNEVMRLPKGFTVHSSRLSSEHARELGWGINEEERTRTPVQNHDNGRKESNLPNTGGAVSETGSTKPTPRFKPRSSSATSTRRGAS